MRRVSLILLVLSVSLLYSQPPIGSKSLLHTHSAQTLGKGVLTLYSDMNFFTRATEFVGSQKPANFHAANYWLVVGQVYLSWGILDNLDLIVSPRIYQDTHYSNEYNLPGDVFTTLKLGNFAFMQRKFRMAGAITMRLPVGEKHNYPFVEYSSGAVEYAFTGMWSYFFDPYLPDRSFSLHLNLGWWNHNEAGKTVYSDSRGRKYDATKNSSELQYAFGLSYPTDMFEYRLEIMGTAYLTEPDEFVYSRENYTYVTPSIRYKPLSWLSADLGVDIRVSSDKNTTDFSKVAVLANPDYNLPNYCSWRVHMGVNVQIWPLATRKLSSTELEREKFKKRVEFFENIVQERDRTKSVQEELERLKKEREQAEKELEELKQILQEEK